jgi:hypothetical protein
VSKLDKPLHLPYGRWIGMHNRLLMILWLAIELESKAASD